MSDDKGKPIQGFRPVSFSLGAARVTPAAAAPRSPEPLLQQGAAALEAGRPAEAEKSLAAAAALAEPESAVWAQALSLRAKALVSLGRWSEAEQLAASVEKTEPADPEVRDRLGEVFTRINLADRATPHFEHAVAAQPDNAEFQFDLASGYRFVGRLPQAEAAYEAAIARAPDMAKAHMALAELRRWDGESAHLDRLLRAKAKGGLSDLDRARLDYALFKELDDLGRPAEAWPHLTAASDLARRVFGAWSADEERRGVEAMERWFPPERFEAPLRAEAGRTRFIFIVGLPRTGTTLIERILAAHSQVRAMGELPTFNLLVRQASGVASREVLNEAVVAGAAGLDWPRLGHWYRQETAYLAGGAPFAIDKLPNNADLLGPIHLAFPDAILIRARRAPMDVLFGAYRLLFHQSYYWSYRQEDLGQHYLNDERLDRHWRRCFGDRIIDVAYEDMVADPDREIRRLLDACGLPLEPACLKPHETKGAVSTASSTQVRTPISRDRQGAWTRYEAELKPMADMLRAAGVDPC